MSSHYGVAVCPDANKNALNVVLALLAGEDPTQSENVSQPLNPTGLITDPVTHWMGGRPYTLEQLAIYQDIPNNMPAASWPVTGVSGAVTLADAQAAAAAMILHVTTQDAFTTQQAQDTLNAVMLTLGVQRVVDPNV
jgi:hypothetical protein